MAKKSISENVRANTLFYCELPANKGLRAVLARSLGVPRSYVTQMLNGMRGISLDTAFQLADLLDVEITDLALPPHKFRHMIHHKIQTGVPIMTLHPMPEQNPTSTS